MPAQRYVRVDVCWSVTVYANMTVSKNVLTSGTTECVTVSLCDQCVAVNVGVCVCVTA